MTSIDQPTCTHGYAFHEFCGTCHRTGRRTDAVHTPAHYKAGSDIECIDAMVAAFGLDAVRSHCRITAFKYLWRFNHKGQADADIKKAIWYLRFSVGDDPREYRSEKGYVRA